MYIWSNCFVKFAYPSSMPDNLLVSSFNYWSAKNYSWPNAQAVNHLKQLFRTLPIEMPIKYFQYCLYTSILWITINTVFICASMGFKLAYVKTMCKVSVTEYICKINKAKRTDMVSENQVGATTRLQLQITNRKVRRWLNRRYKSEPQENDGKDWIAFHCLIESTSTLTLLTQLCMSLYLPLN